MKNPFKTYKPMYPKDLLKDSGKLSKEEARAIIDAELSKTGRSRVSPVINGMSGTTFSTISNQFTPAGIFNPFTSSGSTINASAAQAPRMVLGAGNTSAMQIPAGFVGLV